MSPQVTLLRIVWLTFVFLAGAVAAFGQGLHWSGGASDERDLALIEAWRARQAEIRELQARFIGSVEGVDLPELGTVAFVLEQARGLPRRFLDPDDHNLVFSAVEGQSLRELEVNLPAMVNYIRLSMSTRAYVPAARVRKPLVGRRKGVETLLEIARGVHDFRSEQLQKVRSGQISPAQVLTKANLGVFGQRATLSRLQQAYDEGHQQFNFQRNLVVLGVLAVQLQFGLVVALWIRRKAEGLVVVRGRA